MPALKVPHLETEFIFLKDLEDSDAAEVFEFASHEEVAKTVTWESHRNIEASKNYISRVSSALTMEKGHVFLLWGVKDKKEGKIVGTVSLTQLGPLRAQVGYVFHYAHWSRSVPLQALLLVINYSFSEFPDLQRIQARCFPDNTASRSLLEKVGMGFEGVNRAMTQVGDKIVDLTCYATTRQHWKIIAETGSYLESGVGHT